MSQHKRVVAVGPRKVGFGSWDWVGGDLVTGVSDEYETVVFDTEVPECDIAVFIKFKPSAESLSNLSKRTRLVYCPIDAYGAGSDIDDDHCALKSFDRIVVHAPRLARYFTTAAPVDVIDHALKFATPMRRQFSSEGPILWVGVRSNLPPFVEWCQKHRLPAPLLVLTNPEQADPVPSPAAFGFPDAMDVRVEAWSPARQIAATIAARAAIDIKGNDFRARHKPPAKALDFIASGVPLAINGDTSVADHLRGLGFNPAEPTDTERWLSYAYWEQTVRFGETVREQLSKERVTAEWKNIIENTLTSPQQRDAQYRHSRVQSVNQKTPMIPPDEDRKPFPTNGRSQRATRVAILSLLFNWPSTGGGTVHTTETAKFLSEAGYDVRHFSAEFPEWELGMVREPPPFPVESIRFRPDEWNTETIQRKFREAVDAFAPDNVIITDSWNFKPLLAEAMDGYRYFLRLAAQECICPLNNIRLLIDDTGVVSSCPRNQLADARACRDCVARHDRRSGALHRAERQLSGVGADPYPAQLKQAFRSAAGVLVVNPSIQAEVAPFANDVHVIPSGFDPARFPWPPPWPEGRVNGASNDRKCSLLFAGVRDEFIKGYHVLREAAHRLWARRKDFEIVVTSDPPESNPDPFARHIGWQSQTALPEVLRRADVVVVPTVVEEALGRTAVEAMGVGRPVVASNIGGLPFTVSDGVTGLLFEPGNAADLAEKLERLIDDPSLRDRLGMAGRRAFDTRFTWPEVIARQYRPLLEPAESSETAPVRSTAEIDDPSAVSHHAHAWEICQ